MRRSHALAGAAVAMALAAEVDPGLILPAAATTTLLALTGPRRWLPDWGPRIALAAGAWFIAVRIVFGGPGLASPLPQDPAVMSGSSWSANVQAVTRMAGGRQNAILDVTGAGVVYARLPRYPEIAPGDLVAVEGHLTPLPAAPPPEDEGWVSYLHRIGVAGTLEARALRQEARGSDIAAQVAQLRGAAGGLLGAALPEPQSGLAGAVLLGLRERVDPGLVRDFTASGLSHVVAISGWNLAIVAGVIGALTRPLPRRGRSLAIGTVIGAYALLVGASPSVVRAALMTGIALLARDGGRRAGASRALALALALMLAADPGSILDPGLQLSTFATAGIVGWATPLGARIDRAAPQVPEVIRESLAVSVAAQAATLPVVLFDFGRLSLVSPLANLLAAPLVPFVMAGAGLALPLGALLAWGVPPVPISVALAIAALPLTALVFLARLAAAVPFASIELPGPLAMPAAAVVGLTMLLVWRAGHRPRPRTSR